MRPLLLSIPVLALLTFAASSARADEFTIVGGGDTYTFSLPASPTPLSSTAGFVFFVIANVSDNGAPAVSDPLSFFNSSSGITLDDSDFGIFLYGPQVYSGNESNPTFVPGVYLASDGNAPDDFTVTITSPTPEPSSLVLLATGMLAAFGAARRRLTA